jgi:hypothetical protein
VPGTLAARVRVLVTPLTEIPQGCSSKFPTPGSGVNVSRCLLWVVVSGFWLGGLGGGMSRRRC